MANTAGQVTEAASRTMSISPDAQVAAVKVYGENGAIGAVLLTAVIVILMLGLMLWRVISMYRSLSKDVLATNSANLQVVQVLATNIATTGAKVDVLLQQYTHFAPQPAPPPQPAPTPGVHP